MRPAGNGPSLVADRRRAGVRCEKLTIQDLTRAWPPACPAYLKLPLAFASLICDVFIAKWSTA